MAPKLKGVDHLHVNVGSWDEAEFLSWKTHLENLGVNLRVADNKMTYSL